ncbi:uncharacterized protein DS421_15g490690 [Arachis hypogaea]|nr:uncharacterized protein DS421_15g490690 [Arachis hypogaea]
MTRSIHVRSSICIYPFRFHYFPPFITFTISCCVCVRERWILLLHNPLIFPKAAGMILKTSSSMTVALAAMTVLRAALITSAVTCVELIM